MLLFKDTDILEMANGPFYARNNCGVLVDREGVPIEEVADATVADLLTMPQQLSGQTESLFQILEPEEEEEE